MHITLSPPQKDCPLSRPLKGTSPHFSPCRRQRWLCCRCNISCQRIWRQRLPSCVQWNKPLGCWPEEVSSSTACGTWEGLVILCGHSSLVHVKETGPMLLGTISHWGNQHWAGCCCFPLWASVSLVELRPSPRIAFIRLVFLKLQLARPFSGRLYYYLCGNTWFPQLATVFILSLFLTCLRVISSACSSPLTTSAIRVMCFTQALQPLWCVLQLPAPVSSYQCDR